MKKLILILAIIPTLLTAQNHIGGSFGFNYRSKLSYSFGITTQKTLSVIGFNAKIITGGVGVEYDKINHYYCWSKFSALAGINVNIKRLTLSANAGLTFLKPNDYFPGVTPVQDHIFCIEGLAGVNIVQKKHFIINLGLGVNNIHGLLSNISILY